MDRDWSRKENKMRLIDGDVQATVMPSGDLLVAITAKTGETIGIALPPAEADTFRKAVIEACDPAKP
jgi:hypothetical protein